MQDIIQCSCLGRFGRFGNQLFQYAFARAYAEHHNCILETPAWIGQRLFNGVNERPLSTQLPRTELDIVPRDQVNVDLYGYFQSEECLRYYSVATAKRYFSFQDCWVRQFPKKGAYLAAHLRIGDYAQNQHIYCIIQPDSYVAMITALKTNLPIVWVSDENPQGNSPCEGLEFVPDFFTLMQADVLLRANSTFSWWAGTLGCGTIYSPIVDGKTGFQRVDFVEGNWPRLVNTPSHTNLALRPA